MNIDKLIHDYKIADKVRDGGINFLKEHIMRDYVPYIQKVSSCELLVNNCWYRVDKGTGVKRMVVNSPNLRLLFLMEIVKRYTDVELDYDGIKIAENYDKLKKSGILMKILSLIPKSEIEEYNMLLDMVKSDLMTNEYEVGAYVRNRINDGLTIIGSLILPTLENAGFTKETLTSLLSSPDIKNIMSAFQGDKE